MDSDVRGASWQQPAPGSAASAGARASASARADERAKVLEVAQEFEAFFVLQMIRQMRQSMLDDQQRDGLGAGTMTDTMDVELARQLSRGGGIGLTRVLQDAIDRQVLGVGEGQESPPPAPAGAPVDLAVPRAPAEASPAVSVGATIGTPAPATVGVQETAVPLPLAGAVSSHFGYRPDPFNGAVRFHSGVDILAAYGREVPAAGAGQVVFSGAEGGYGNTVVIEHAGGVRTRYAHLSSIQVETGARVDAGTVVGRVGSSGRSTGPHLHFEVLQGGHPVNPEVAATRFAGLLKIGGAVADLPISQPSVPGVAVGVDDEDSGQ